MEQRHCDHAQPALKRLRVLSSTSSSSSLKPPTPSSSASSYSTSVSNTASSLLFRALTPIRFLLHRFLTDEDAARLLRTSRPIARSLLSGYSFTQHVFIAKDENDLSRMAAMYEQYDMRPTRVTVLWQLESVEVRDVRPTEQKTGSGIAVPNSVSTLAVDAMWGALSEWPVKTFIFGAFGAALLRLDCRLPWNSSASTSPILEEESDDQRCERLLTGFGFLPYLQFDFHVGNFEHPVLPSPPTRLPCGLRMLQLAHELTTPLLPGFIPPTVQFLQLNRCNHPLVPGALPHSLLHLVICDCWQHPLPPGVLPPQLETLTYACWYRSIHPLEVNSLPSSLRVLRMTGRYPHPLFSGIFPSGLLHLHLHLLSLPGLPSADAFPQGLLTLRLKFSRESDVEEFRSLPVGHFPSSLRDLQLGPNCAWLLRPGTLPEGLQFLCIFGTYSLPAGVLPSSLVALDASALSHDDTSTLCLPAELRYLRLPAGFDVSRLQVPPTTKVSWRV